MIRPGLERITRLLAGVHLPWKAIHVAGTNGKGSICTYLSALLHRSNIRCGRFTSPHIIDRWDCITVDEKPIAESTFKQVENRVKAKNDAEAIDASEFELLTATAFEIFTQEKVEVAVIECGVGGRLDATNVLEKPLVTVISRIGMDHQGLLGDTYTQIAFEKAGIIKTGVDCVVDRASDQEALHEIDRVATDKGAKVCAIDRAAANDLAEKYSEAAKVLPVQRVNLQCAIQAFRLARSKLGLTDDIDWEPLIAGVAERRLPGRFQTIDISTLVGTKQEATIDGAHNVQAWQQLRDAVDTRLRGSGCDHPVTWVIACSEGKDSREMFSAIPTKDRVVLTQFGPVDGMLWVQAMPAIEIMPWRAGEAVTVVRPDPIEALKVATHMADDTKLIIAGSLYLVSDVLRLLRSSEPP